MNDLKAEMVIQNKLDDLSNMCLKSFSELKEAVLPQTYLRLDNVATDTTLTVYLYKKVTLSARLSAAGGTLTVLLDGTTVGTCASTDPVWITISAGRGKHTLTLSPSAALSARLTIDGGALI